MDLEKFLALLCDSELYLSRVDDFRDPWEGLWPKPVIDGMRSSYEKVTGNKAANHNVSVFELVKFSFFVNCWHASEHESAGFWDLYAGRARLAVKSTVGRLKSSIHSDMRFFIGQVEYLDFGGQVFPAASNLLTPAFLKRKSFEHEHEVRVLVWGELPIGENAKDLLLNQLSKVLPVDLNTLIDAIYVSPTSPKWFLPYVKKILDRFELSDIRVEASTLYDQHVC